jgi:hypothetical protein
MGITLGSLETHKEAKFEGPGDFLGVLKVKNEGSQEFE